MRAIFFLGSAIGMLVAGMVQAGPVQLTVVPGSSSAYLYFPGSGDNAGKTVFKVEKRGDFQNYSVNYTVDGGTPSELCSVTDELCEVSLPASEVTLSINGSFAQGLKIGAAKWSGDCSVTGIRATCTLVIDPSENQVVRVEAACDGSQVGIVSYNSQDVLCVGQASSGDAWLLAAHLAAGGLMKNGSGEATCNNNDTDDGRINRQTLVSSSNNSCKSAASDHCANLTHAGLSAGGWYLPAINELTMLRSPSPTSLSGKRLWSSTEADKKKAYTVSITASSVGSQSTTKKYKDKEKYFSSPLCYTRVNN